MSRFSDMLEFCLIHGISYETMEQDELFGNLAEFNIYFEYGKTLWVTLDQNRRTAFKVTNCDSSVDDYTIFYKKAIMELSSMDADILLDKHPNYH